MKAKLVVCGFASLALFGGASNALADVVKVIYSGTVSVGSDLIGIFGVPPGSSLAGLPFTASYLIDTAVGTTESLPNSIVVAGSPGVPVVQAALTINGRTEGILGASNSYASAWISGGYPGTNWPASTYRSSGTEQYANRNTGSVSGEIDSIATSNSGLFSLDLTTPYSHSLVVPSPSGVGDPIGNGFFSLAVNSVGAASGDLSLGELRAYSHMPASRTTQAYFGLVRRSDVPRRS